LWYVGKKIDDALFKALVDDEYPKSLYGKKPKDAE